MTTVVYVLGVVLNVLVPGRAFDIALEAASLGIVFTWGTIFACQLKLRSLVNKGIIPRGKFQAPGHPYTSVFGLVFLVAVIVALAISGWLDKSGGRVDFYVVVVGIPVIAALLTMGWFSIGATSSSTPVGASDPPGPRPRPNTRRARPPDTIRLRLE